MQPRKSPDESASVITGEPIDQYHADREYLNASSIADYLRCPSLFNARRLGLVDQEKSRSLNLGSLIHDALELGPEATAERLEVIPDEHVTASGAMSTKKATKEWLAEQPEDALLCTAADAEFIGQVFDHMFRNKAAREIYENLEHKEVSIRFEYMSKKLRCRPDGVTDMGVLVDYKTTRHANPLKQFWKSVDDFYYHVSHALYLLGAGYAGFSTAPMRYVVIGTTRPTVHVMTLPQEVIDSGRRTLDRALSEIELREATEDWTPEGYGEVHEMRFPVWFRKEME